MRAGKEDMVAGARAFGAAARPRRPFPESGETGRGVRMDVRFDGTWHGRRIYRVMRDGAVVFRGTLGECRRFIRLHLMKREKESRSQSRRSRRRPYEKRYRVAMRRAGAFS